MEKEQIKSPVTRKSFALLDERAVFDMVREKMEKEKIYLDRSLTMESLAARMNIHRNMLSRAVNRYAGKSFPCWLGSYRVAEVERQAAKTANQEIKLEELALEAGFSSRSSFYRVFKKIRNALPSLILRH